MKTILFQGDSITDGGRWRDNEDNFAMGVSYPNPVAAILSAKYPNEYKFYNKGISGNRIIEVYARIKEDIINLKPDYMSLLIGVNDVWHELSCQNGIDEVKFEKIYTMLIEEVKEALPELKIFLMTPFVLEGEATREHIDYFRTEVAKRVVVVKRIAAKFDLPYIELQPLFDDACTKAPADYWLKDGVHPDKGGSGLIANAWIEQFEKMI